MSSNDNILDKARQNWSKQNVAKSSTPPTRNSSSKNNAISPEYQPTRTARRKLDETKEDDLQLMRKLLQKHKQEEKVRRQQHDYNNDETESEDDSLDGENKNNLQSPPRPNNNTTHNGITPSARDNNHLSHTQRNMATHHLLTTQQAVGVEISQSVLQAKCRVACRSIIWSRIKFATEHALVINGPVSLKIASEMGYDNEPQQRLFMSMWEGTYKKTCSREINSKRSSVCQTIGVFLYRNWDDAIRNPDDHKDDPFGIPELDSVYTFLENPKASQKAYCQLFLDEIVSLVVGKIKWNRLARVQNYSSFATISDEAFALLALRNGWNSWVTKYKARHLGNEPTDDIQPLYTSKGYGARHGRGWNITGTQLYMQHYTEIESFRNNSSETKKWDTIINTELIQKLGEPSRKRKKDQNTNDRYDGNIRFESFD